MINPREGNATGLPETRRWSVNIHNATHPLKVTVNGKPVESSAWKYNAAEHLLAFDIPETSSKDRIEISVLYSGDRGTVSH